MRPRGQRGRVLKKFHKNMQLDKSRRILHPPHLGEPAGRASTTLRAVSDPPPPCSGAGLAARCSDMASTCHLVFSSRLQLPEPAASRERHSPRFGSVRGRRTRSNTSSGTPRDQWDRRVLPGSHHQKQMQHPGLDPIKPPV